MKLSPAQENLLRRMWADGVDAYRIQDELGIDASLLASLIVCLKLPERRVVWSPSTRCNTVERRP